MNLRQAAQQALEVLKNLQGGCTDSGDGTVEAITVWCPEVIEGLEQALAEPEQEPCYGIGIDWGTAGDRPCCTIVKKLPSGVAEVIACEYGPTPPQRKPQTTHWEGCEAVHPECKGKNT